MHEKSNTDVKRGFASSFDVANLPEALQEQTGAWLRAQSTFLDATQKMMSSWRKCRQDDMQATLVTLQRVWGSKGGADVAAAYAEWLSDSMKRINDEFTVARDEALRLTGIDQQFASATLPANVSTMPLPQASSMSANVPTYNAQETIDSKSNLEPRKRAVAD